MIPHGYVKSDPNLKAMLYYWAKRREAFKDKLVAARASLGLAQSSLSDEKAGLCSHDVKAHFMSKGLGVLYPLYYEALQSALGEIESWQSE